MLPSIVDQFLERYAREYDYFNGVAQYAADITDAALRGAGVRAIVTFRAKRLASLAQKIEARAESRSYDSIDSVYDDIVDLAGIRIALFFPGDRNKVEAFIEATFDITAKRDYPMALPSPSLGLYSHRFSGYSARHYRVRVRDERLPEGKTQYARAPVEIQLASVLMLAWQEVNHDMVYKPLSGVLSKEEHAILDELNGLVLAGEIALERLQHAAESRVSEKTNRFLNHYDLASYIQEYYRLHPWEDVTLV